MKELTKMITKINLEMSGDTKKYLVSAKQGDKASRFIVAKLLSNGEVYMIPDDSIVAVNIEKPDGKVVFNNCEHSGSEVTIELTSQALAAAGEAICEIEVLRSDGSQVITSASFTIEIEKKVGKDDAIKSSNEYTELQKLIAGASKYDKRMSELETGKASNEALELERKRIDNLTTMTENGETTDFERELADVRVGEDGEIYDNAGAAVRGQFTKNRERMGELSAEIAEVSQSKAGAIVLTKSGTEIRIEDGSDAKLEDLRLNGRSEQGSTKGYQLFDASVFKSASSGGATVTNNGDGSFTVSGSGNTTQTFQLVRAYSHEETIKLLKAGNVYVNESEVNPHFEVNFYSSAGNFIITSRTINDKSSGTITEDMIEDITMKIYIYTGNNQPIVAGTFKPMLYQDGDGTWEPFTGHMASPNTQYRQEIVSVGDSGSVVGKVTGKNLFGGNALADKLVEVAKATKDETAGAVTFTAPNASAKVLYTNFKENTQYTFIVYGQHSSGNTTTNLRIQYTDNSTTILSFNSDAPYFIYTSHKGKTIKEFEGRNSSGTTTLYYDQCGIFEGVVELDDFEAYTEQNVTFETPNGLQGIPLGTTIPDAIKSSPIHMSGVYWDNKKGQYYIADTKNENGKDVQRIVERVFNGTESWTYLNSANDYIRCGFGTGNKIVDGHLLCTHSMYAHIDSTSNAVGACMMYSDSANATFFAIRPEAVETYTKDSWVALVAELYANGTPLTIKYILAEPIETPLSDEEIAAYKELHTNKPTTVITNDAGCMMDVAYVADTKTYIDNKFQELATALLAMGGE